MEATVEPVILTTRSARLLVVAVGAAVPVLAAAVSWWLGVPFMAAILAGGAVAGPLVAVRRAQRLVGPRWLTAAVASGIEAPFVAAGLVVLIVVLATPWSGDPGDVTSATFGALLVFLYAAIFGLPCALPVAVVAGWLVRRAARLGPDRARRHVALLVVVAASAGAVTAASVAGVLAIAGPQVRPIDWAEQSAAVRLELTIENRTLDEPEIEVGWRDGEGSTGWLTGAPACTRATDRFNLDGVDWYVARVVDDELDSDGGTPIVAAADWPGRDVAITVILEPGGTHVEPGVFGADGSSEAIAGCPGPT